MKAALVVFVLLALAVSSRLLFQQSSPESAKPASEDRARKAAAHERIEEANKESLDFAVQGDLERAATVLEEALHEDDSPMNKSFLMVRAGMMRSRQGAGSLALERFAAAEKYAGLASDAGKRTTCEARAFKSQVYLDQGLIDLASKWAKAADELTPDLIKAIEKRGTGFDCTSAFVETNRARIRALVAMEDYPGVDSAVSAALIQPVYATNPQELAALYAMRGIAFKEASLLDPTKAELAKQDLEKALAVKQYPASERVYAELALAELALQTADWSTAEKQIASAEEHLGPVDKRTQRRSYAIWVAMKARLLVDRADVKASPEALQAMRGELRETFDRSLAGWKESELRASGYGHLYFASKLSMVSELLRLEMLLEPGTAGKEAALRHVLAASDAGTLARRMHAPAADLDAVRATLLGKERDRALLVYFPAPDRSHLFLIEKDAVEHYPLAAADYIERARADLSGCLVKPLSKDAPAWERAKREKALAALAELLLPTGLQARLDGHTHVDVVGCDLLGEVPFEALPILVPVERKSKDGTPSKEVEHVAKSFGLAKAIAYLPSIPIGLALAERAKNDPPPLAKDLGKSVSASVVLLGAPPEPDLRVSTEQFASMLGAYPEPSRRIARGRDASLAGLRTLFSSARVGQIFTHGTRDADRERPTGFLLASSGADTAEFVGADEIDGIDAPPLVVMTICASGRAPRRRGDPSASDLAGVLLAGSRARCIVQSSYDLEIEAARLLSVAFHAAIAKGDDPAEAMRKARVELAANEKFADLFYHELLSVVGLGHEPVFAR